MKASHQPTGDAALQFDALHSAIHRQCIQEVTTGSSRGNQVANNSMALPISKEIRPTKRTCPSVMAAIRFTPSFHCWGTKKGARPSNTKNSPKPNSTFAQSIKIFIYEAQRYYRVGACNGKSPKKDLAPSCCRPFGQR